jgi:hypothetical protein
VQKFLVMLALAALAPAAIADRRPADEAAIRHIKTEVWPSYYRNQDVAGLGAFLADEFVNIAPDGTVTPKAEELASVRKNAWSPANFRYTIKRIDWLSADLALVIGEGASDREDDKGKPCRHRYASSNLLRRAPDSPLGWQALSSHVSGDSCTP